MASPAKVFAVLLLGVLPACARPSMPAAASAEPYMTGRVESFTHHATASRLLVQPLPGARAECGIAGTVDARTRYLRRSASGGPVASSRSEVGVGDTVAVYVEGPVARSCPAQGYISTVLLKAPR